MVDVFLLPSIDFELLLGKIPAEVGLNFNDIISDLVMVLNVFLFRSVVKDILYLIVILFFEVFVPFKLVLQDLDFLLVALFHNFKSFDYKFE